MPTRERRLREEAKKRAHKAPKTTPRRSAVIPTGGKLTTPRQEELLRIIKAQFSKFNQRQQHYYLGGGMSTSHVVVKAIADSVTIRAFWPSELVRTNGLGGTSYVLKDDVFERIQDAIREVLLQLETKGHLEKVGNKDERRWKPTYAA